MALSKRNFVAELSTYGGLRDVAGALGLAATHSLLSGVIAPSSVFFGALAVDPFFDSDFAKETKPVEIAVAFKASGLGCFIGSIVRPHAVGAFDYCSDLARADPRGLKMPLRVARERVEHPDFTTGVFAFHKEAVKKAAKALKGEDREEAKRLLAARAPDNDEIPCPRLIVNDAAVEKLGELC